MKQVVFLATCAILLSLGVYGLKSEEKCAEYSQLFKDAVGANPPSSKTGGKIEVTPGEFPHMAHLGYGKGNDKSFQCGGSLISDQYILTLASCTENREYGPVSTVILGQHNVLKEDDPNIQEFNVAEIITHPYFKRPSNYNDIALLKLDKPVKFTKSVRPACLHTKQSLNSDDIISATGWGRYEFAGDTSDVLLKVYLDQFTTKECNTAFQNTNKKRLAYGIIEDQMICAGGRNEPKDTCQGDSGGPLQILKPTKNIYEIAGITAFGKACFIVGVPAVYIRVSYYVPWIETIVWA